MIVADTNLLVALHLPSVGSESAERVLQEDPAWAVPSLWRSEFRNVLATARRGGRLDLTLALEVMEAAERLVRSNEFSVPSSRVLELAATSGCSAYDCEFVALAEDLDVVLVTSDRQVLKAFAGRTVAPESFGGHQT